MKRHLKLVTLACAGVAACATPRNSVSVAPASECTPGTVGVAAQTPRERAGIAAAVAALRKGEVLVEITERSAKPQLINAPVIARLLERHYPPHLRDAGRSGEVTLLVEISDSGGVSHLSVLRSASEPEFNAAALSVVREMRFRPARHGGCAVPVWTLMPVTFSTTA